MITVQKKNNKFNEVFDGNKIARAVSISASRVNKKFTQDSLDWIINYVIEQINKNTIVNSDNSVQNITTSVDDIHKYVISALKEVDYDVYEQYSKYVDYKQRFNNSFATIMSSSKKIVYSGDKENANKNSAINSTKKELLSGLVSKELMLEFELPQEVVKAHKNNDIYIHDLSDRFIGSINCIEENAWITFKDEKGVRQIQLKDLCEIFDFDTGLLKVNKKCYVLGRNGWTRLKGIMARYTDENDKLYTFKTRSGLTLKTTGKHKIPIIRNNKEFVVEAKDIIKGDSLINSDGVAINPFEESLNYINLLNLDDDNLDLRIVNIKKLKKYVEYKYDRSIQEILRSNNINHDRTLNSLTVKQLKSIMNDIEIPYDVFSVLRVKANGSKNDFPLILPITESLAKLYGYIYADGGVYVNEKQSTYHLTFTNTNEELIDDFINCFEDVFGIKLNKLFPTEKSTSPCIRVCSGSRILVKLFNDFAGGGKKDTGNISMPDFILNSNKRVKLAYLSACIDTDGCLSDTFIGYCTSSEKYADQLISLIQSLGYNPTKTIRSNKGEQYRFGYTIGTRKYDNYIIKINRKEEINKLYNELSCFKTNSYYERYDDFMSLEFIESKISSISIDDINTFKVFDLETESNWFIANGYVVHNCCLFDMANVLKGGFDLNGVKIKEPQSVKKAGDIICDIIMVASSQQYGK